MKFDNEYYSDLEKVLVHIPEKEKIYGSKIYITGVTGLICSAVTDILLFLNKKYDAGINLLLAGRDRERVRERFPDYKENADYFYVKYDATRAIEQQFKTDYIIHGAGISDPVGYARQPVETMLTNINGINELLKMASSNGNKRVLYISSSEVYGSKNNDKPFKETDYGFVDILKQRSCYPSAKKAAETLCIAYSCEHGVDVVIARPGHIFGQMMTNTDSKASAQFAAKAAAGNDIVMKSAGTQVRSYCYSLDCAAAVMTILIKGKCGEAYNISNRDSVVTIREFAETMAEAGDVRVIFEEPSETEKSGYSVMTNSSLCSDKLEALDWRPCFTLKEAVHKTICGLRK